MIRDCRVQTANMILQVFEQVKEAQEHGKLR